MVKFVYTIHNLTTHPYETIYISSCHLIIVEEDDWDVKSKTRYGAIKMQQQQEMLTKLLGSSGNCPSANGTCYSS